MAYMFASIDSGETTPSYLLFPVEVSDHDLPAVGVASDSSHDVETVVEVWLRLLLLNV